MSEGTVRLPPWPAALFANTKKLIEHSSRLYVEPLAVAIPAAAKVYPRFSVWMRCSLSTLLDTRYTDVSGLFGLGGGVLIVPALIFLAGFDQHTATGTSRRVTAARGARRRWNAGCVTILSTRARSYLFSWMAISLRFGTQ